MAIPRNPVIIDPDIYVPYDDPARESQYSEFMKKEDINPKPKYEAEKPLYETLQEDPITLGEEDVLGYGAGDLWTLSEEQKKRRKEQLGKLGGTTDPDLLFGWGDTGYGSLEPPPKLDLTKIEARGEPTAFEDRGIGAGTTTTSAQYRKAQELLEESVDDPDRLTWLEKAGQKALSPEAKTLAEMGWETGKYGARKAKDLWSPAPDVPTVEYPFQVKTGLDTLGRLPSSGPPPASLAGQGDITQLAGATGLAASNVGVYVPAGTAIGLGTATTIGSSGTGPVARLGDSSNTSWLDESLALGKEGYKFAGKFIAMYGASQGWSSGNAEGQFSGSLTAFALMNPAAAPFVAAYEAIKWLTGWSGITETLRRWGIGGGSDWNPSGGVEFRVYDTGTGLNVWPDNPDWKTSEDHRIRADVHWGYDGFDSARWMKAAKKNVDYLYALTDEFKLDVNEEAFMRALMGSGVPRHKPSGDQGISWLERLDSVGNGAPSAPAWLRTVMEYEGPNGERIVSGTAISSNIDPETGNYIPITSQDEFQTAVLKFNQEYGIT